MSRQALTVLLLDWRADANRLRSDRTESTAARRGGRTPSRTSGRLLLAQAPVEGGLKIDVPAE